MTNNMLAIIPARGGSKGLPRKNIIDLAGKPLIAWSIQSALKSHTVDRVVVSTDCSKIAQIAKNYGAEVPFLRPNSLATDTATTESAMLHTIFWLESNQHYFPDNTILLQPTSPFRTSKQIKEKASPIL